MTDKVTRMTDKVTRGQGHAFAVCEQAEER